ncbi:putative nucleotide-binding alpha-beta plait domain superfamily, RNA-binding domain superfamily [Helianthus annuus]|nr:putative nucleotide-binding alpha-beta plait domain superfamily, RNA-binding domain superfamily [Helianthus annuus]
MFQIDIYMQSTSSVSSSPIQRYRFKPQNIIFLNPSFNKQDLDFFYLIIFISSSSLELLGSQMLHSVTFWCKRTVQVGHLSDLATEREIHDFFSFLVPSSNLRSVGSDSEQQKTAFVKFKDPKALEIALLLLSYKTYHHRILSFTHLWFIGMNRTWKKVVGVVAFATIRRLGVFIESNIEFSNYSNRIIRIIFIFP